MTVFADGTKERLHGHNYTVAVAIEVDAIDLAAMIPFAPLKAALAELCDAWRERVLIAKINPFLEIVRDDSELEFRLCGERYVMPRGDALLLPIENISVEALAQHIAERLRNVPALNLPHVLSLAVTIEETPGQGATCELAMH